MSDGLAIGEGLTGTRADWLSVWKAAASSAELSYRDVDHLAGLTDGYFSRLASGDIAQRTAETIDKINRALDIRFYVKRASDSLHGVGGNTK